MYLDILSRGAIVASLISLVGCSALTGDHGVFRVKSKDYLQTESIKKIELPEGMQSRPLVDIYDIPEVSPKDEFGDPVVLGEYDVPRPIPVNSEKGKVGVKMQKLGERKWIFINASTSQVWPRTQNFLSQYGIVVTHSNPSQGLIETHDVVFKDQTDRKSRFRVYIQKGVHPETTEVHIVQVDFADSDVVPEDIKWPEVSHNIERERMILSELATVLAESVDNNSASLLGQNVGGTAKVEYLKNQAEPTMRIRLFKERAEATVAHALDRDGFVLWEEAADGGLYYVDFDPDVNESGGFFTKLFTRSEHKEAPYKLEEVLQHLSNSADAKSLFANVSGAAFGDALPESAGYLIFMNKKQGAVDVVIRDMRGQKIQKEQAKVLLRILRKNLI